MRPVAVSTFALLVVAPCLGGCALLEGGGHLDDALDVVPAEATNVEFVDRAALAERLDVEDTGAEEYLEAAAGDPVGGTRLSPYLAAMAEGGAAFDERDVEWGVSGQVDRGVFTVYKLDDDVDLDAFGDELADLGFAEDEVRDRRHFVADLGVFDDFGLAGGAYPIDFREVAIDPDEQLVVLGDAEALLGTLDDEADSMTDAGTFDDVLDGSDDVEYAWLVRDPDCSGFAAPATEEQLRAREAELGDLGSPVATAYLVSGDDVELSARVQFGDDDEAEADLEARRLFLDEGLLLATQQPFSDLGSADLERDGAVVQVAVDLERPELGRRLAQENDGFLVCR